MLKICEKEKLAKGRETHKQITNLSKVLFVVSHLQPRQQIPFCTTDKLKERLCPKTMGKQGKELNVFFHVARTCILWMQIMATFFNVVLLT